MASSMQIAFLSVHLYHVRFRDNKCTLLSGRSVSWVLQEPSEKT